MQRIKTFDTTAVAPNGVLYAGDLNAIQDAAAALSNFAQGIQTGTIAIGEAALQFLRFGPGDLRLTGSFRADGIIRALSGLYLGAFTTSQRDAIPVGQRPYGLAILNTTLNQWQLNIGTDPSPVWIGIGSSSITSGTLGTRPSPSNANANSWFFATDVNGGTLYYSTGTVWTKAAKGLTEPPALHGATHDPLSGTDTFTMSLAGNFAGRPTASTVSIGTLYTATDVNGGTVYRTDGSTWTQIAAGVTTPRVTALPGSPTHLQEVILVNNLTNPSWQWRFQYNATSTSAYKWEFIGGAPMILFISGATIPGGRPGDYLITAKGSVGNGGTTSGGDITAGLRVGASQIDSATQNAPSSAASGTGARGFTDFALAGKATGVVGNEAITVDCDVNPVIMVQPYRVG